MRVSNLVAIVMLFLAEYRSGHGLAMVGTFPFIRTYTSLSVDFCIT